MRLWFQAAWFVLTNSYLRGYTNGKIYTGGTKVLCVPGLNCYSCPGALGSCPMGALQAVLGDPTYRVSLYVFGVIAAMGVFFGRLICGWMCPFGLVQDLLYKIKVKTKKKNLPGHQYLKYLRYVILIIFPLLAVWVVSGLTGTTEPWFCELICPSGTLLGGVPLVLLSSSPRASAGIRFAWKVFLLLAIVVLSVFYYRPFCKYLCPLGALYGVCNPISTYRLVIDQDKCVSCGKCQKVCGMDIKTFQNPNSPDCIRCGQCVAACPTGAIESTWGRTGRKVQARLCVEDTAKAGGEQALNTAPGNAIFLGIVMITGALSCLIMAIINLHLMFSQHEIADVYRSIVPTYIGFQILWLTACVMVLFTGIYALRYRNEPVRLLSLGEKIRIAVLLAILGVVVGVLSALLDIRVVGTLFTPVFLEWYVIIGIPLLLPLCGLLRRKLEGKKAPQAAWVIGSILGFVLAASPWLMLFSTINFH